MITPAPPGRRYEVTYVDGKGIQRCEMVETLESGALPLPGGVRRIISLRLFG